MPLNPTDDGSLIFFSLSSVSVSVSISDLEIVKRASEQGSVLVLMYGWLVMETGERGRGWCRPPTVVCGGEGGRTRFQRETTLVSP